MQDTQKKKLLFISGSRVFMGLMKKLLERAGYSVRCALGLSEAEKQFSDYMPDGVLLERELPDGSGLLYCQTLRETCDIPILILSNDKDDELPALSAGASGFLKKPFDFELLKARLDAIMHVTDDFIPAGSRSGAVVQDGGEEGEKNKARPEIPDAPAKTKNKSRININVYIAAAVCTVVVVAAAGVFITLGGDPFYGEDYSYDIIDEPVPLALFEALQADENAKPYIKDTVTLENGPGYSVPRYESADYNDATAAVRMLLANTGDNHCL